MNVKSQAELDIGGRETCRCLLIFYKPQARFQFQSWSTYGKGDFGPWAVTKILWAPVLSHHNQPHGIGVINQKDGCLLEPMCPNERQRHCTAVRSVNCCCMCCSAVQIVGASDIKALAFILPADILAGQIPWPGDGHL